MIPESLNERWKTEGAQHWLVAAWQEGLRQALESMAGMEALAGARWDILIPEPDIWSYWPAPFWCQMDLGSVTGAFRAGAPRPTVEALGRLIARDPQFGDSECEETFLELINRAAAVAAKTFSDRTGHRQQFSRAQISSPPAAMEQAVQIDFHLPAASCSLALLPSPQLLETLGPDSMPAPMSVLPPATAAGPTPNLDLLLEVELPVIVTFGRTQLPLRDVLKLSSGSIVELNRLANEPVEVLINNCVIARGEVVVVEGNYGIRVTEIVSRQERIRSIF